MIKYSIKNNSLGVMEWIDKSDGIVIPFDPANTDYQKFKFEINNDKAELQDSDNNTMTSTEAKAFVATLP